MKFTSKGRWVSQDGNTNQPKTKSRLRLHHAILIVAVTCCVIWTATIASQLDENLSFPALVQDDTSWMTGRDSANSFSNSVNSSSIDNINNINNRNHLEFVHNLHHTGRLIVAIDWGGTCPGRCVFAHRYLPSWVSLHHRSFRSAQNLTSLIESNADHAHFLLVTRGFDKSLEEIEKVVSQQRAKFPKTSFGLFHMADEFMSHQLFSAYGTFDYVLRHYFASDGKQPNITQPLRALGNLTCGANAEREQAQLMRDGNDRQPKYGIHWAFLLEDHPIFSAELHSQPWPIQLRPTNCSFSGRQTPKRLAMQRQIQQWQQRSKNDLSCSITFTKGFRLGISAFQYAVKEIGRAKIGLHPSGNNDECYRLGEMLSLGTVPALLDSPFLHATYKQVPAIIGTTWPDVARRALSLLRDEQNGGTRLQELSSQGAEFWKNLQTCMQDDMNIILRRAFNG